MTLSFIVIVSANNLFERKIWLDDNLTLAVDNLAYEYYNDFFDGGILITKSGPNPVMKIQRKIFLYAD